MKLIKLTQGQVAMVDDADYDYLNQWKWYLHKGRNTFYALRGVDKKRMHRVLMSLTDKRIKCDHKDHNGLNNQRSNLRVCTNAQNCCNRRPVNGSSSKYLGVSFFKQTGKWEANIKKNYKKIHLGLFINERDAAAAYNEAAINLHGEFANLNAV